MFSRKIRLIALGVMALLVANEIAAWSVASFRADQAQEKEAKVKALLKERHAVLESAAAAASEEYRNARASRSEVAEAIRAARNAALDLCDTDQERVSVLEKMLAEAKDCERSVEREREAARATQSAALKATADRLEVEISLERAKGRAN